MEHLTLEVPETMALNNHLLVTTSVATRSKGFSRTSSIAGYDIKGAIFTVTQDPDWRA